MSKTIAIKITKCTLVLTERELISLLTNDPDLYQKAIKRGKAFNRATRTHELGCLRRYKHV